MGPHGADAVHSFLPHLCPFPHTLQKVVLSSVSGPGLDLPLILGITLQLKLTVSKVVLSQGTKKEILALPPMGPTPLLNLWAQTQGRLFLEALPGKKVMLKFLSTPWETAKGRGRGGKGCIFRGRKSLRGKRRRP